MHRNHHYNNTTTAGFDTAPRRRSFLSGWGGNRRRANGYGDDVVTTRRRDHREGVRDGHHVGGMHIGTHGGTTAPVHHHKRHVTIGDKISGAMMRLRGSMEHRPGVKAAGTRRMHGTDGRGSRRVY